MEQPPLIFYMSGLWGRTATQKPFLTQKQTKKNPQITPNHVIQCVLTWWDHPRWSMVVAASYYGASHHASLLLGLGLQAGYREAFMQPGYCVLFFHFLFKLTLFKLTLFVFHLNVVHPYVTMCSRLEQEHHPVESNTFHRMLITEWLKV